MLRSLPRAHASFARLRGFDGLTRLVGRAQAERETRWMAEHVAGNSTLHAAVRSRGLDALTADGVARLESLVSSRAFRTPLQYLLGSVSFLRLPLRTRAPILIPRPETEAMLAWTLSRWAQRDYRRTCPHLSIGDSGSFHDMRRWMETVDTDAPVDKAANTTSAAPAGSHSSSSSTSSTSSPLRILDLCSGSGNIALSLFHHLPYASHVLGGDFNPSAVSLARENLAQLKSRRFWHASESARAGGSCAFVEIDLLEKAEEDSQTTAPLTPDMTHPPLLDALLNPPPFVAALSRISAPAMNRVNLIVSNPPYIPSREYADLQPEVRDHEDYHALISGAEGMDVHEAIIRAAPSLLHSRKSQLMSDLTFASSTAAAAAEQQPPDTSLWDVPELVMEIGSEQQAMHIATRLQEHGFGHVTIHHDLAGLPRFVAAAREKTVPDQQQTPAASSTTHGSSP